MVVGAGLATTIGCCQIVVGFEVSICFERHERALRWSAQALRRIGAQPSLTLQVQGLSGERATMAAPNHQPGQAI